MIAQSEEPVNLPDILDINDPDAEGTIIGDELHSETCPCDGCAEEEARWEKLWAEKGDHRTPDEKYADREEAKERREKKLDHEAWLVWDRLMGEAELEQAAIEERNYQESLRKDDPDEWLLNRERALKDRELVRRERRADAYDAEADEGDQVAGGEALEDFVGNMAEADAAPPSALLRRSDGEILFYDGEVNWVFGEPGSGKSWLALYVVQESILRGQRTVFWDHEMSPGQTKARCLALGLDLVEAERNGKFLYLKPYAEQSALAMSQLKEWQRESDGPALVVIDAASSSGAPSDGGDVEPWLKTFVNPFADEDHTVLVLDHVAKQRMGRPDGPIGSARKLQATTGSALDLSGIAWTQRRDGVVKLTVHKDRYGALPASRKQPVARIYGRHVDGRLNLSIEPPEAEDNIEAAYMSTLRALKNAGPDGAQGQKAMRDLIVGRGTQRDKTIGDLVDLGFILKTRGKKVHYSITALGLEELAGDDGEG